MDRRRVEIAFLHEQNVTAVTLRRRVRGIRSRSEVILLDEEKAGDIRRRAAETSVPYLHLALWSS